MVGNVKVTRNDWLNVAMDVLVSDGVEQVKVLDLGQRLGVSRSSFYWYFKSRQDLLDALLQQWQATNTAAIVAKAEAPAKTLTDAVCNFYFMQLGYDLAELNETTKDRLLQVPMYLFCFTGQHPRASEIAAFKAYAAQAKWAPATIR